MLLQVKQLQGWQKVVGLIGKNKTQPVYFQTRFGIHTFGIRKSIDIVILDKQNYVVKLKSNLQPNRIFVWNPKYEKVLELPGGTITKNKILLEEKVDIAFI